jgi:hypothetical protein
MHTTQHLTLEEASRLAVTATTADLEDWAHGAATHGRVELSDLVAVLDILRTTSTPEQADAPLRLLAAG